MVRSMFSGVSGLRNHQVKMDVIGNNIANVNTQGFKASRATFKEMYNQTVQAPSGPTDLVGGTNPMQVGLGVTTGAIDVIFGTGNTQTTDRPLDLAIEGEGFFAVTQGDNPMENQTYYTRSGNLYLDANGYLVTAGGMFVNGFMAELDDYGKATNMFDLTSYYSDYDNSNPIEKPEMTKIQIDFSFTNLTISKNGMISGIDSEGTLVDIACLPLACFVNPSGLDRAGDNLYLESKNSGYPVYRYAAAGTGAGDIKSSALEMSNVDLSKEFTEMIVTQRGFQANSRVITVSDTLLEELINLKR